MKKSFLKILAICLGLFLAIDSVLYILFGFECVDALLKLLGVDSVISVILRGIVIVAAIVVEIFITKYDAKESRPPRV